MNEVKRDLAADLKLCQEATPGPVKWQKFGFGYYLTGQYGMRPIILGTVRVEKESCYDQIHISNRDQERDLLVPVNPIHPDSKFIEEAWHGWPHAIRRAIEAERELKEAKAEVFRLQRLLQLSEQGKGQVEVENTELKAECDELRQIGQKLMGHVAAMRTAIESKDETIMAKALDNDAGTVMVEEFEKLAIEKDRLKESLSEALLAADKLGKALVKAEAVVEAARVHQKKMKSNVFYFDGNATSIRLDAAIATYDGEANHEND